MWFLGISELTVIISLYSFKYVLLEKYEEDKLDRCREKWRSVAKSKVGQECPTWNKTQ